MKKKEILDFIIKNLKEDFEKQLTVTQASHEGAISEEAKQEGKYDTRAIEASYLAGAQAKRLNELKQNIFLLESMPLRAFCSKDSVELSALVELDLEGNREKYFLAPVSGGIFQIQGTEIKVISMDSPIGKEIRGLTVGESIEVLLQGALKEYTLTGIE